MLPEISWEVKPLHTKWSIYTKGKLKEKTDKAGGYAAPGFHPPEFLIPF